MTPRGIALCDDLIFFSRMAETAKASGLTMEMARTPTELLERCRTDEPGGVILDLHLSGLDLPALLRELRGIRPIVPRVIAYGSHVEAEVLRAARRDGCDLVLPRSRFVEQLDRDLAEWLTPVPVT